VNHKTRTYLLQVLCVFSNLYTSNCCTFHYVHSDYSSDPDPPENCITLKPLDYITLDLKHNICTRNIKARNT